MHVYRRQLRLGIQRYQLDLPVTHIRVLKGIGRTSECTAHKIVQHLGQDKARVTRVLNELMTAGLIIKTENPQDRRSLFLSLTETGHDMLKEIEALEDETAQRMAGDLSDEEVAEFVKTVSAMIHNAGESETRAAEQLEGVCLRSAQDG
ncbi:MULTISPECIES: MarR family winged helix-turn-helix transcriptional regulator [unclassified Cobetia]|uniref:MarR family winged helix-turn-helix transcriptional regulator n=1 Tax=unclassified Cobetia TaxID=2609414 RepID=UPI002098214A|nr:MULTISPECIES: MarR family transcriptional regulator [unclassified Cobetia]MCO7233487.1 MarR family transcriptional regulator [Cobetia sp. Dlab-2-AX]MCO7236763.1 MarR family transcriptional regulator [Cobetia sp. Dlab-2-U]